MWLLPSTVGSRWAAVALAAAAGTAWALAAPPRGWWPLLPLGVAALTIALAGRGTRDRLLLGAVAGAVLYPTTLPWLTDFSPPGYVVMAVLQTALLAGAAALTPTGPGRWGGRWWTLPATLVLLEAVQTRFPLGGFPLPGLVHSQPGGPFALAAPLGGSLLVTAVAATAGVALAALVLLPGIGRRAVGAGAALVAASVPLVAGAAVHTQPAGTLDAAVVQGGGPRGTRAVFTDPDKVTARQLAVARTISGSPDLVLLPEGVVVVDAPLAAAPESAQLAELARRLRTTLVVGVVEAEADGFRNAAVSYSPEGTIVDRYEKKHRVPFGEYIPARELLSRFTDATALVPSDAIVGQTASVLRLPTGVLGVVISYEIFFADRVREAVTGGGQLIVLPTNASSYVSDEVPATEVAAARLRAREFGRAVLQAAPTGYSVIVLPGGDVLAQSELGGPALLRATVPLRTGLTPYARIGDLPAVGLALVAVLSPGSRRRRAPPATRPTRRQRSRTPEGPLEAASPTTLRRRK